ncbi:hypothetical protein [Algoriphagus sp.]|uniref:hypothetical protein n=1 Tax=Algoriphagus sp. TaxID=1872435 RepID=UPI0025D01E5B|nr:hypothetical protein [Algoriphagus sp.]
MKPSYPFKKIGISALSLMVFCFLAGESFAQGEQEKVDLENVKQTEKLIIEDQSQNSEINSPKVLPSKVLSNPLNKNLVKRDLPAGGVDKEIKKEESSPSTLSFNIFLYIVDKFKAD